MSKHFNVNFDIDSIKLVSRLKLVLFVECELLDIGTYFKLKLILKQINLLLLLSANTKAMHKTCLRDEILLAQCTKWK